MNITKCWEGFSKKPPKTLKEIGCARILNRKIIEYCGYLGSYGMGGPGFSGFKLESTTKYHAEWLVLTLWGSENWMLYDGQWVSAHPNQYDVQRPLIGFGDEAWDEFSSKVIGAQIVEAEFGKNFTKLCLRSDRGDHLIEIPEDTKLLSKFGGSMKYRTWKNEDQREAWVISKRGKLRC